LAEILAPPEAALMLALATDRYGALSEVPSGLDRLERGHVLGRIVVEIQAGSGIERS
jgi:hypothetical protein